MKDVRFAKFVIWVNGLVPATLLLWDVYHKHAGANPVKYTILTTGILALTFLTLSMLVTPLRKITGFSWLYHFRRILGLYGFFYALAHFSTFFIFDRSLSIHSTLTEMYKRPYLIVGSLGLLSMVPLAATSTNYMIKKIGSVRWRKLHRLAYFAAMAGAIHFYMQVKSDIRKPVAYIIVLEILLGYRLVVFLIERYKKSKTQAKGSTGETIKTPKRWSGQLRIEKIIQETPDVKTFRLVPTNGDSIPFTYLPGQYLTLTQQINGKTVRRSYTIASTPSRTGYCALSIKREEKGLVSLHMHDTVKEGDVLSIAAPAGKFTFTGTESNSIALLAAGVGITPLMSILRYLTDKNWNGQIYLFFCNRTVQDIIFRKEIEELKSRFPNLHLILTLTRVEGTNWNGNIGRIDAKLLTSIIPNITNIPYYLCGPAEMLKSTKNLLREMGVAETNIHMESFGSKPSDTAAANAGNEYTVTFSRSNKAAPINGNKPILTLADELDIGVDSECRSGICGRCKCKIVSGSVKMETQDALDNSDRQNNIILLCQARALEDIIVEA